MIYEIRRTNKTMILMVVIIMVSRFGWGGGGGTPSVVKKTDIEYSSAIIVKAGSYAKIISENELRCILSIFHRYKGEEVEFQSIEDDSENFRLYHELDNRNSIMIYSTRNSVDYQLIYKINRLYNNIVEYDAHGVERAYSLNVEEEEKEYMIDIFKIHGLDEMYLLRNKNICSYSIYDENSDGLFKVFTLSPEDAMVISEQTHDTMTPALVILDANIKLLTGEEWVKFCLIVRDNIPIFIDRFSSTFDEMGGNQGKFPMIFLKNSFGFYSPAFEINMNDGVVRIFDGENDLRISLIDDRRDRDKIIYLPESNAEQLRILLSIE